MTTICVDKLVKDMIEEFSEMDESVNSAVNRLLDEFDNVSLPADEYDKNNIRLSDDTFKKLKSHRLYNGESNASVLARLLFAEQLRKELIK